MINFRLKHNSNTVSKVLHSLLIALLLGGCGADSNSLQTVETITEPTLPATDPMDTGIVGLWRSTKFNGEELIELSLGEGPVTVSVAEEISLTLKDDDSFLLQLGCLESGTYTVIDSKIVFASNQSNCPHFTGFSGGEYTFEQSDSDFTIKDFPLVETMGDLTLSRVVSKTVKTFSEYTPEQFINQDYIDLSKINTISRFRSGEGHDYTMGYETCRSMKHYYEFIEGEGKASNIAMYAPFSGTILGMDAIDTETPDDHTKNRSLYIQSTDYPHVVFKLHHMDILDSELQIGSMVTKGQQLGYTAEFHNGSATVSSDISVRVYTDTGVRLYSVFEFMTPELLANYTDRGIGNIENMILTEEQADAAAYTCEDQEFTHPQGSTLPDRIKLN